jgi:hypothetical protein
VSGIVVTRSAPGRSDLVTLGATSVLTDALGEGKITIAAVDQRRDGCRR